MASNERNKPRSNISTIPGEQTSRTMHSCCTCVTAGESHLEGTVGVKIPDCLKKGRRPRGWQILSDFPAHIVAPPSQENEPDRVGKPLPDPAQSSFDWLPEI